MSRFANIGVRVLVTLAALWLAFEIADVPLASEFPTVRRTEFLWAIAGLHLGILLLIATRFWLLARQFWSTDVLTLPSSIAINWAGLGLSQVALGLIGGDAGRAFFVAQRTGQTRKAILLVMGDRILGLIGLGLLFGLAVLFHFGGWLGAASGAAAALGIALAAWPVVPYFARQFSMTRALGDVLHGRQALGTVVIAVILTTLAHALNVGVFLCVAALFEVAIPPEAAFLAVPAGILGSILPLSLGGWGARELALVTAFGAVGVETGMLLSLSIAFGLTHVAIGIPGLIIIVILRVRVGRRDSRATTGGK